MTFFRGLEWSGKTETFGNILVLYKLTANLRGLEKLNEWNENE